MGDKGKQPPDCPPPPPCCPPPCCPPCDPPPYVIPPACQFQVQGVRELQELEKALAKLNLKDPWIRNEAWRFHPGFGTRMSRATKVFFRGLPLGAAVAAVVTVVGALMNEDGGHH